MIKKVIVPILNDNSQELNRFVCIMHNGKFDKAINVKCDFASFNIKTGLSCTNNSSPLEVYVNNNLNIGLESYRSIGEKWFCVYSHIMYINFFEFPYS